MQDDLLKATTATDITTLPPAQRAALVLESTKAEAQLRELVALSSDILEVKDKAGREQAHRAGMTLKNARVGIEKAGKLARDDANAFSKAVVAEQQRLTDIVTGEETRIFGLRDSFDAIEAARKAELERIEQERVRGIRAKIEQIKTLPHACLQDSAADLAATIADLRALVPDVANFHEYVADAVSARDVAIVLLQEMHVGAVAREAEALRLAAERAELEAQRAAQAERERQAAADQAERDRVAAETKRQLDAQQAAIAAERQAEATRLQAERDALEAERRAFAAQQHEAALEADRKALAQHQAEAQAAQVLAEARAAAKVAPPAPTEPLDDVIDTADEAAEAELRGCVECLELAVRDLVVIGLSASEVHALVDIALASAVKQVAA